MTLKTFMQKNLPTEFEIIPNTIILNIVSNNRIYALDVDTSSIQYGTKLIKVSNYSLENDLLTVGDITVNANEINVLIPTTTENADWSVKITHFNVNILDVVVLTPVLTHRSLLNKILITFNI